MDQPWEIEGFLEIKNNHLHVGGIDTATLAAEFDTPLFVFSEARIRDNIARLKRAAEVIDCPLKICYAAKANSVMGILRAVRDAGSDIEVNSSGELWKALEIGFKPEQIIFNGTSKTEQELEDAINAEIYAIQSDSIYELEMTEKVAKRLGKRANVSLRLVPEIESETLHGLQTALLTSKFGMMPAEAHAAFRRWHNSPDLNLCGIHLHIGSQNPSATPYTAALMSLFENLVEIYDETGHRLSHLNLGGGFPINYLRGAEDADLPEAQREFFAASIDPAEVIGGAWNAARSAAEAAGALDMLENITLLLEPGRSVIADAGVCLTTVRNHKERPILSPLAEEVRNTPGARLATDNWLLTDAGFNILLSMETYKWYYHLVSAGRSGEAHDTKFKLAGPLCDGGDVYFDIEGLRRLPDHRLLPKGTGPGDVLALLNCGAYSLAQMSQYNGRALPAVVLVRENGAAELIRKRDGNHDLINNDLY